MEKIQKAKKSPKSKKKQPLKVVYITNPIKFKASASEFRALVQELTGQDADTDTAYSSASFSAEEGGGEAVKVAAEDNVHAEVEQGVITHLGRSGGGVVEYDPLAATSSFDDGFVSSLMIDSFQGWAQT